MLLIKIECALANTKPTVRLAFTRIYVASCSFSRSFIIINDSPWSISLASLDWIVFSPRATSSISFYYHELPFLLSGAHKASLSLSLLLLLVFPLTPGSLRALPNHPLSRINGPRISLSEKHILNANFRAWWKLLQVSFWSLSHRSGSGKIVETFLSRVLEPGGIRSWSWYWQVDKVTKITWKFEQNHFVFYFQFIQI